MKCDFCKNAAYESASMDYPYPSAWCSKGHWDGMDTNTTPDTDIDPWRDCVDFESSATTGDTK